MDNEECDEEATPCQKLIQRLSKKRRETGETTNKEVTETTIQVRDPAIFKSTFDLVTVTIPREYRISGERLPWRTA